MDVDIQPSHHRPSTRQASGFTRFKPGVFDRSSLQDRWLYWFLHAHEYEVGALLNLFPEEAIRLATQTINKIAEITEDKEMYDAREKAIRDRLWAMNASRREGVLEGKLEGVLEGEIKGEIKLIQTLEEIIGLPQSKAEELEGMKLEHLQKLTSALQDRARNRS